MVTSTGNRGVVCATDDVSAQIEALQFSLGEGPCIDAVTSGVPVLIPDLTQPGDVAVERWPAFMEAASGAGVQAVFALPLRIGVINVGAMDLYRVKAGDLEANQLSAALMAADAAAIALLQLGSGVETRFADDLDTRRRTSCRCTRRPAWCRCNSVSDGGRLSHAARSRIRPRSASA